MKKDRVCDSNCNKCPLLTEPNARMLTKIFNQLYDELGEKVFRIVESNCPNLTCCYDCHIDDFCHLEGCKLIDNEE